MHGLVEMRMSYADTLKVRFQSAALAPCTLKPEVASQGVSLEFEWNLEVDVGPER